MGFELKLALFKDDQRPDCSDAASHVGAAVLAHVPVAVDRTLFLDERSFNANKSPNILVLKRQHTAQISTVSYCFLFIGPLVAGLRMRSQLEEEQESILIANQSESLTLEEKFEIVQKNLEVLQFNSDTLFLTLMGSLIILMQAGFGFLEAGSVRAKNTTNILIKNYADLCFGK